jgi:hypothetical protein
MKNNNHSRHHVGKRHRTCDLTESKKGAGDQDDDNLGDSLASLDVSSLGLDYLTQEQCPNNRNCVSLSSLGQEHDGEDHNNHHHHGRNGASMSSLDVKTRRKSLPEFALGPKQHGVRGGVIAQYGREAIREVHEETKAKRPPTRPIRPFRRTLTAPEARRNRDGRHEVTLEHDGVTTMAAHFDNNNNNNNNNNKTCHDRVQGPPNAQEIIDSGVEIICQQASDGAAVDPPTADGGRNARPTTTTTLEDWWNVEGEEEEMALQDTTESFCSNVFIIWNEEGEQDPVIVVSEGQSAPHLSNQSSSSTEYHDARSVASEPANMGMFDDSFHTLDSIGNLVSKQWLMAWDDLALL